MCGIAVAIDWDGPAAVVQHLIAGIMHRGDVTDPLVTVGDTIAMCTRRLRIVDAAHGAQPQTSSDGRILVCLNGEIYNHVALRRELEAQGVRFRTACDTEVVANVIGTWGPIGVKRLSGMYAFVAVDTETGDFVAARDPFGVKPLYLIQRAKGLLFCSEIKPLLDATETDDVLLLPPGHMLTRNFVGPHYTLPAPAASQSGSPQELDDILGQAVRARVPADLPVAGLFSGGIDSTLVMHYARRHAPGIPGYIAVGPNAPDYVFAKRYADDTKLDLREVKVAEHNATTLATLKTVVETVETFEPAAVRPSLYTFLLSERIHRDGFRVALCGEGADELFAGYAPLESAFLQANAVGRHLQTQCLDMMHRANLQRVDRCSMRFQLEIREPFLDRSVAAYAQSLDRSALIKELNGTPTGKAPLRALYDLYPAKLPASIRDRQKVLFHEGADGEVEQTGWLDLFEEAISDAEFHDGLKAFSGFQIGNKEELFYVQSLAAAMDISRVPHLRGRLRLEMPRAA
ncbi:MAG TPA: asparagine synthase-related protein [Xanthobacteraceae bacterium]|jgi:asparagine synthase (glutamine-hydrolysing)|nr:asparagine synthase-related protein [Xanthobacteraceae bacterium]